MLVQIYKIVTPWAKANKIQCYINRGLGAFTNIVYPIYCLLFTIKKHHNIARDVVISLTTYPNRINEVYHCLNSLLRQNLKAEKVILWLASSQFPNEEADIPQRILKLKNHGLTIRFCEDLRSYKKVYFTAKEMPRKIIITADDDTLYPENFVQTLFDTYKQYPNCVVCFRAHEITFLNQEIAKYSDWNGLAKNIKGPSMTLLPTGVGGVLYPEDFFKSTDFSIDIINDCAPTTDDIWLKIQSVLQKVKVVKVYTDTKEWFTVKGSQKTSLKSFNVDQTNSNDIALKKLNEYYTLTNKDYI